MLELLQRGVYAVPGSPYRELLIAAGYPLETLREKLAARGVEATLAELRDAGVYLTADEFKGRAAVTRGPVELRPADKDFDNPRGARGGIRGGSSGTSSRASQVVYDWRFLAQEAENETLLYDMYGLAGAPTALWYPARVSIAGMHNLLLDLRRGAPPARWFSHTDGRGARDTLMRQYTNLAGKLAGMRVPRPETVTPDQAHRVAAWLREAVRGCGAAVLRTFASSAVRVAQAALAEGNDLAGCTLFVGGERLAESSAALIRSTGARAVPRFITTETGLVAVACPHRERFDEMHVYLDRLAAIPGPGGELLFTTLLPTTGKILLNTSVGDLGELERRACGCFFASLGMDLLVSGVRSASRLTQHGMSVEIEALDRIVAALVVEAGGSEADFQLWQRPGGLLSVAVDPAVEDVDDRRLLDAIHARLAQSGPAGRLASDVWRGAGSLQVVREKPRLTAGQKQKRVLAVDSGGRA